MDSPQSASTGAPRRLELPGNIELKTDEIFP